MRNGNPLNVEGSFEALYRERCEAMLIYFARRVVDADVALELTAETFAQAFESRRKFRGATDDQLGAWLYAIARNQLSHYLRRGRVERRAIERLGVDFASFSTEEQERVEELADLASLRDAVAAALGNVAPDHRFAIELRVVDELPYPEVAGRLGVSENAARARVSRGLKALGAVLKTQLETKGPR